MLLAALLCLAACRAPQGDSMKIRVDLAKEGDTAKVDHSDGRAVIDVSSATGIGHLTAQREAAHWPDEVVVRLRLKGLEQLTIAYDNVEILTGVSSSGDAMPLVLRVTDESGAVQAASPSAGIYYPTIRRGGGATDEFFEVTLPPHFHQALPPSFELSWIDFYR